MAVHGDVGRAFTSACALLNDVTVVVIGHHASRELAAVLDEDVLQCPVVGNQKVQDLRDVLSSKRIPTSICLTEKRMRLMTPPQSWLAGCSVCREN